MKRLILISLFVASQAFGAQLYYSAVTVDHTKVPSDQTNFAVLVSQTDNRFKVTGSGGHVASSSGYDIRPYSDAGLTTALTFQLEKYVSTTGELVMWVKIPTLSSTVDKVIYLGYGDSSLTTDGSSTSTWDANYKAVWHLSDGTTLSLADATTNGFTLTNTATVGATTGKVDGGAGTFNGTSQALNSGAINLTAANQLTLSAWINTAAYANDDDLFFELSTNFNSNNGSFIVNCNDSGSTAFSISVKNAGGYNGSHFTRPSTGSMHYFVFTFDLSHDDTAAESLAWVDGVASSMTQDTSSTPGGGATFGNFALYIMSRAATSLFHSATALDEVRLSTVLRSQNWITTEYNNQSNPGTFETLGTEVNLSSSTTSNGFFLFFP